MKKFTAVVAAIGIFALPAVSLAATYHYIAMDGSVKSIEAANPTEALTIAHQNGAAVDSGVKIDVGVLDEGENYGNEYTYVAVDGELKTVTATSFEAAFLLATDRMADSGFLVEE